MGTLFRWMEPIRRTDAHGALIFIMVLASTSDGGISDSEVDRLSEMVKFLPVFASFDLDRLPSLSQECIGLLQDPDGIDLAMDVIETALPPELRETGYALACEVIATDGFASQEELRLLGIATPQIGPFAVEFSSDRVRRPRAQSNALAI